ncbi:uncharacterized protein LOC110011005 [Jatropha curcas]|uniref:uncharacterized protein LOC110011005 n=1 Tax=Jatropha curcas TaxID=180498 RepID=UPI0009D724A2|nr:uncharacterized protein LOC110011005 [Jatropha curcas]
MYYLGGRVTEWELGPNWRRVPYDVPYFMLSTRSIRLDQGITAARRGFAAIDHLVVFMPGAYAVFVRTQLLVHIPRLIKFDPFAEAEELDIGQGAAPVSSSSSSASTRRGFEPRALDMTVVIGMPEHGPGPLSPLFWTV